ncbi:hypothetical protein K501DRAFT_190304, partial [Backusella circina FSU 941]
SAIYMHLKVNCALSMKKLEKILTDINSVETLKKRRDTVLQWLADKGADFGSSRVFLDEAGFNLHMTRTRDWSKKVTAAKTIVPASKGTAITILSAISSASVKRKSFETGEALTPKITNACSHVTRKECRGWIHYSLGFFERCLALEKNL